MNTRYRKALRWSVIGSPIWMNRPAIGQGTERDICRVVKTD